MNASEHFYRYEDLFLMFLQSWVGFELFKLELRLDMELNHLQGWMWGIWDGTSSISVIF